MTTMIPMEHWLKLNATVFIVGQCGQTGNQPGLLLLLALLIHHTFMQIIYEKWLCGHVF